MHQNNVFVKFLAGFLSNLSSLSSGLCQGFSAILLPQLEQPESEIKATLEQGSWIGVSSKPSSNFIELFLASLFTLGALTGSLFGGHLAER